MKLFKLSILFAFFLSISSFGQELSRRATFNATISWPSNKKPGAKIMSIEANSPLEKNGLKVNDIIIKINGRKVLNQEDWSAILFGIKSNKKTIIHVKRNQN